MATPDYYNILGVDRRASQQDIKKAYRALARKFHPDLNSTADNAEQRFKEITAAYKTLADPDRRKRYDRLGPLYTEDGRPPSPDDINEVVGTMFTNIFRRRGKQPGEDLRYTVSLTLEDVSTGVQKEIVVPRRVRCPTCVGDGAESAGKAVCSACDGSGRASGPRLFRTDCYHCDGQGFTITEPCASCEGEGRMRLDDHIRVKVKPGVGTGQKLKVATKGNSPRGSGPPGDLLVIVNVADHELFRRRGDDILLELPLTFTEIALGADVTVPTLEGTTAIRIPAGSPPGKVLRLAGRGLPSVSSSKRGDLHVQLVLEVPSDLDGEQLERLQALADSLTPENHPQRARFDRAVETRSR